MMVDTAVMEKERAIARDANARLVITIGGIALTKTDNESLGKNGIGCLSYSTLSFNFL